MNKVIRYMYICIYVYIWSTPHPVTVTNEGFGWEFPKVYRDSLQKMVHNPRGDWHPGWGGSFNIIYNIYYIYICIIYTIRIPLLKFVISDGFQDFV